jgi:putative tryptophan/tyrosine transport system substrate-binding protein
MTRRTIALLVTFVLGLLVVPLAVTAQPYAPVPRIGLLCLFSPAIGEPMAESFRQGLRELGYVEGQNIRLESRWAAGHPERLAELAADLVRIDVAVMVTESTPAALAAKQATQTIPIVTAAVGNPVATGLVANPAHRRHLEEIQAAAHELGLQLQAVAVRTPSELDQAFEALARLRPSALITLADGMLVDNRAPIVAFAAQSRLPAIFPDREFAEAGGLMT